MATPRDQPLASTSDAVGALTPSPPRNMRDVAFEDLCALLDAIRNVNRSGRKGAKRKREILDGFHAEMGMRRDAPREGAFDMYRLVLPQMDKERAAYGLKEAALARCLGLALGLKRGVSPDFIALEAWRKQGTGVFALTAFQVCHKHMPDNIPASSRRATVGEVNDALDKLAGKKATDEKVPILRALLEGLGAVQMRWLVAIILKDLKLGCGESFLLRHYHPDAEDLYNVCCDLRRVVMTLNVRDKPFERQDLSPGSLVNAMNSSRVNATEKAFKKMQKRKATFVIETKFDGERIQVHRTGEREFKYLTRNNIDFHPRGYSVLDRLFRARLKKTTCVLDGELVIWNKREKRYLEFGYLKGFINAIGRSCPAEAIIEKQSMYNSRVRDADGGGSDGDGDGSDGDGDGSESDDDDDDRAGGDRGETLKTANDPGQYRLADLELVYVAFDVLYDDDHSVIHRPLSERHDVLRGMFKPLGAGHDAGAHARARERARGEETDDDDDAPVADQSDGTVRLGPRGGASKGRVQIHVPAKDPTEPVNPDCVVASMLGEIETYFWRAVDRGDEGLIIKDLGSKWEPGARGDSWLKIKPDYLPTEDLDVVIIGGFYGTGRQRGGKIAEYLLGIVETPTREGARPTRVMSFSKVGTGMSVDVMQRLREKLGPHMLPAGKGYNPPTMYDVTGAAAETPDVWIDRPENSVVLTVKADIRLVRTMTFRADVSLRFPRVTGVRWDKPWHDALSNEQLAVMQDEGGIGVAVGRAGRFGNRTAAEGGDGAGYAKQPSSKRHKAAPARDRRLPAHLAVADTSAVTREGNILRSLDVRILAGGDQYSAGAFKAELAALVKSQGGKTSEARSIHWSPYDPVRVVNAVP